MVIPFKKQIIFINIKLEIYKKKYYCILKGHIFYKRVINSMALKEKIDKNEIEINKILDNETIIKEQIKKEKKSSNKKIYSIRLPEKQKNILEKHFDEQGISFSSGVRMILYQYIKKKKLKK